MNILSINNLAKIGREKPLFTGVTFGIQEGEKAALIGRNGTGKSTLLATIAGVLVPDEGTVVINKEAGVSYLPQTPSFNPDDTIREHIFKNNSPKLAVIREYEEICEEMGTKEQSAGLQTRYEQIMHKMDSGDLWNYEAQISSILSTLGITDMTRRMGTLSGGMCKKVALAQVLVEDTKLLLLDEPTNHLDITTIFWLQNYLHDTKRSVLMVTHDRWFLDAVCTNIYELARNKLKLYVGNYSQYLEKKETEAEIEANTERRIESVLRFEREWLLRGPCARGTKIKARIQRDEQLINREKFQADKGFTFEVKGKRLGGKVLELHGISKNYPKGYVGANEGESLPLAPAASSATPSNGGHPRNAPEYVPVIKNFSYIFTKGQKIGIFGDNGSGKSTFLNIITGQIAPDSGTVVVGENTKFGYYTQNPVFKDTNLTVLEYIKETAEHMTLNDGKKEVSATKFLEEFGFEGKIQHSPVSTLSGGERKRLYLVRLLLENPNFLVLDEPTNDFDIFTMNILEQFLEGYQGCLLLVSHDRYFMDKTVDSLFIMEEDGNISGFVGKCSEYIDYREEKRKEEKEDSSRASANSTAGGVAGVSPAGEGGEQRSASQGETSPSSQKKKLSFKEQKEFEQLNEEIPALEAEQKSLEEKMASSDFEEVRVAGERYKEIEALLEEKYPRWEELAERA
ncbi:ATP-binding cassette, subfamily F, uup [Treponema bryantii]|uniref:ATP-binding cassette, subfamily F, uup n=1 Tax=Treponema bryantii TaxID=163 RepID=A0A1H9ES05_9SPIR|nr:ABC-F family ATP-binding cassette domain-containing protein [Treponema bryantii]SEQ27973.1 ATP-binding cassette, subfamily F, uup [Treponema bryantii]